LLQGHLQTVELGLQHPQASVSTRVRSSPLSGW
jgi:hypothetical protein